MRRNRLHFNILFMGLIFLSCVITIIFISIYFSARNLMESQLGFGAQSVASAAATVISSYHEEYSEFVLNKDMDSRFYNRIRTHLVNIKESSNLRFLYTLHLTEDGDIAYILDAEPFDSEFFSAPGEIDFDTAEEYLEVFNSELPMYVPVHQYRTWGYLISAYAGIYDDEGNMIGIVGADVDASGVLDQVIQMILASIVTVLVMFIIIIIISFKLLPFLLAPMIKDKLTGAYNKRYFEENVKSDVQDMLKHPNNVTFMMLDLDHFKKINDTYGHPFGDKVLINTASIIGGTLRKKDYFIRYGGEEFMIVLTRTMPKNARAVAERIRQTIEKTPVFHHETQKDVYVTISIGMANADTLEESVDELINKADKALYKAKVKRNNIASYK